MQDKTLRTDSAQIGYDPSYAIMDLGLLRKSLQGAKPWFLIRKKQVATCPCSQCVEGCREKQGSYWCLVLSKGQ